MNEFYIESLNPRQDPEPSPRPQGWCCRCGGAHWGEGEPMCSSCDYSVKVLIGMITDDSIDDMELADLITGPEAINGEFDGEEMADHVTALAAYEAREDAEDYRDLETLTTDIIGALNEL